MCRICPECGGIAEYNAYYKRVTCTRCNWESEQMTIDDSEMYSYFKGEEKNLLLANLQG